MAKTSKVYYNKQEFINDALKWYKICLKKKGIDEIYAGYLTIQDCLESNFGKSYAANWNFGNITVGSSGASYTPGNDHDGNGNLIINKFRNYDSFEDFCDHKIALLSNKRYHAFIGPVSGFYQRVKDGGYAGDPNYVSTLTKMYNQYFPNGVLIYNNSSVGDYTFNFDNLYANSRDNIKKLQIEVGVTPDGIIGPKTIRALQIKIGTVVDGIWGPKSAKAAKEWWTTR